MGVVKRYCTRGHDSRGRGRAIRLSSLLTMAVIVIALALSACGSATPEASSLSPTGSDEGQLMMAFLEAQRPGATAAFEASKALMAGAKNATSGDTKAAAAGYLEASHGYVQAAELMSALPVPEGLDAFLPMAKAQAAYGKTVGKMGRLLAEKTPGAQPTKKQLAEMQRLMAEFKVVEKRYNDAMVAYNAQFLVVMQRNGLTPPDWMTEMGQATQALQN